jgi:glucose/arabinose dehydrogenase
MSFGTLCGVVYEYRGGKRRGAWRRSSLAWTVVIVLFMLATAAFGWPFPTRPATHPGEVFETAGDRIRVVTIVEGLDYPWSLAFLPDGNMLVTERVGRLRIVRHGVLDPRPIAGLRPVHFREHGGLLDVALHPHFADNRLVYLTYSLAGDQGTTIALARGRLDGAALTDVRDIFIADAWSTSDWQFGSRIAFSNDGTLYMSIGDRNERHRAQDLKDHAGTIIRIRDDGSVPTDNPFVGQPYDKPEIYSFGHRNVQGLAVHPETGTLWASEHGPYGGDEVNVILPGRNYGWPLATFGREYDGTAISKSLRAPNTNPPFVFWVPSIGVSGMMIYSGRQFPAWAGNLFVGALAERKVQRVTYGDAGPHGHESLLVNLGYRIRDVREGPDGLIYVVTDGAGQILRIEPADLQSVEPDARGVSQGRRPQHQ